MPTLWEPRACEWFSVGTALLASVAQARLARAEFFQFNTTLTVNAAGVSPAGSIVTNNSSNSTIQTPGSALITLTGAASNPADDNIDASNGTDIVFGNISLSNLNHASPGETVSIPYTFQIQVANFNDYHSPSDPPTSPDGVNTFLISGVASGSIGPGNTVNITNNTYSPSNVLSLNIGSDVYTLSLLAYIHPGPSNAGAFGAHVTAREGNIPEPSTVVLLGLGGCLVVATPAFRRRRSAGQKRILIRKPEPLVFSAGTGSPAGCFFARYAGT